MSEGTQNALSRSLRVLVADTLYAPEEVPGPVAVLLEGPKIRAIWRATGASEARQRAIEEAPGAEIEVVDLGSLRLAPGLIDLHIHGFHGHDITAGSQEDMAMIARELPCTGVTSFFPTIATTGRLETAQQVQRIAAAAEEQHNGQAAEILGIRLEGPFISLAKKGAQYEPGIRRPDPAELTELAAQGRGWVRIIDYAPEVDSSFNFLATAVQLGILPCIGHTAATYEQALRAIDGGARHSTHLFNAMSGLEHRAPGVPGALLTDSRASVEIIADSIHLHPAILKLVVAIRGPQDVALITDAVMAAGLPDGEYDFTRRKIYVSAGSARLVNGTLAGSVLTLDHAVRNMVKLAGLSWSEAIRMATLTPACIANIATRKGRIAPGADADLLALDAQGFVRCTWAGGCLVYEDRG